jgi:hypothetical protein
LFLLSIMLLPVTNGLYGNYQMSSAVGVIYGGNLTIIAALNGWLWWLATSGKGHAEIIGAIFPVLVFIPGTAVAAIAPHYAPYFWFLAFGGLLVRRFIRPRAS